MNIESLKEWASLNPRTFVPKVEVLEKYGVKPKEYMFLREVSVGTINYAGQASGAILGIKDMIPTDMRVLFSLEEKKRRDEYPADWIMLQEAGKEFKSRSAQEIREYVLSASAQSKGRFLGDTSRSKKVLVEVLRIFDEILEECK